MLTLCSDGPQERLKRPEKRWKLSPMDLYARSRWSDYSYAKDVMFSHTDTKTVSGSNAWPSNSTVLVGRKGSLISTSLSRSIL